MRGWTAGWSSSMPGQTAGSPSIRTSSWTGRRPTGRIRCGCRVETVPRTPIAIPELLPLGLQTDWPWLAFAGLGLFHGLNPAMGWLFAVALGLHRQSRRVVLIALTPIAIGHALAILAVILVLLAAGEFVDPTLLKRGGGVLLIGWAA